MKVLVVLVLFAAVCLRGAAPAHCIIFVDDVSGPAELAQHGIAPASPDTLGALFDVAAAARQTVMVSYLSVREKADRNVPVCVTVLPFTATSPQRPDRNLPMAELEVASAAYRRQLLDYENSERQYRQRLAEDREKFIRGAMDAQAAADAERDTLRSARSYAASDIEGAVLGSVNVVRASGASKGIVLFNSDLVDAVRWRKNRDKPFTSDELPAGLIKSVVFINTSLRPDASPLMKDVKSERLHAGNISNAVELLRGQLERSAQGPMVATSTSN